jgi:hypothetical protein
MSFLIVAAAAGSVNEFTAPCCQPSNNDSVPSAAAQPLLDVEYGRCTTTLIPTPTKPGMSMASDTIRAMITVIMDIIIRR